MIRGTFANIRLRNQLAPGTEGGFTVKQPGDGQMSIYDASRQYQAEGIPLRRARRQGVRLRLVARLGRQGHALLGVRAVIAESYERIHRSNLIGMGVLPLQYRPGSRRPRSG